MAIQIKGLICPQCGATGAGRIQDVPNLYRCRNCSAEFVLSDSNAPRQVHVVHSFEPTQFALQRQFKVVAAVMAGVAMLLVLAPFVWDMSRKTSPPAVPAGRLEASTVYQAEGGRRGFVRVLESGNERSDRYRILVTDLDSGKALAQPQDVEFQRNTRSQRPAIRHFSDGGVYLILNAQRLMRLEPAGARFVDLSAELIDRHLQQLGAGVAKIEFPPNNRYPDMLEVTTNTGEQYHVHWITREIVPRADSYEHYQGRPFASYTGTARRLDFADARSDKDIGSSGASLLVSYTQKVRPGEYEAWRPLEVRDAQNAEVRRSPERYTALSPEWVYDTRDLHEKGIGNLALVPPVNKRFRADVLAHNATRVLLAYNPTPVTEQGRVLQLIDARTDQIVWSRTVDQLPQITRNGVYMSAHALPTGFYIASDGSTPSLLIDNDGNVVHDFRTQGQE